MAEWWNTKGWKVARNMGIAALSAALGYVEVAYMAGDFGSWGPVVMAINGFILANLVPKVAD